MGQEDRTDLDRWSRATKRMLVPAFATVWSHLVIEDPPPSATAPFDAIFCFGSRHWRVPERAADLHLQGAAPIVLVTGGPAAPGEAAEADRFARTLVARGVPAGAIVTEDQAAHTGENVHLGVEALRRHGRADRLLLVSWPLATRRCRATFAALEPHVEVSSAPALRRPDWRWVPTPRRARFALGELDRLERYGRLGLIAPQPTPPEVVAAAAVLAAHLPAGTSADRPPLVEVEAPGPVAEPEDATLLR